MGKVVYKVVRWDTRYDVTDKGRKWEPGMAKRAGPLNYTRTKVQGRRPGPTYKRLAKMAGKGKISACIAVFEKLCDLAADLPADIRDGHVIDPDTLEPLTIADICEITGQSPRDYEKALPLISDPKIGWIEIIPAHSREVPENSPSDLRSQSTDLRSHNNNDDELLKCFPCLPPENEWWMNRNLWNVWRKAYGRKIAVNEALDEAIGWLESDPKERLMPHARMAGWLSGQWLQTACDKKRDQKRNRNSAQKAKIADQKQKKGHTRRPPTENTKEAPVSIGSVLKKVAPEDTQ